MKAVILAGGNRSTISNEQEGIPKPMLEIGGKPLLWHIMKSFSAYGIKEFIICGGYKVDMIKEYFMDFYIYQSDITVDLQNNTVQIHKNRTEDWKVTVVDTGLYAATGQRVAQIQEYIDENEFIVTYGDCLSDIALDKMLARHMEENKLVTMAVARPTGRNCVLDINDRGDVRKRKEVDINIQAWTSAGIYIMNKKVFSFLNGNYELEQLLIDNLSDKDEITSYKHDGFWMPIETYRDRVQMENMWNAGIAPWYNT